MTTRTRSELVTKILEKLGVLPEGQTPVVEDSQRVDRNLPSLIAELAGREIVYVTDLEQIPEAWFLSLADVAAWELRNEFGIIGEALVALKDANDTGIMKLKAMLRGKPTYEPLRVTYV